MRVEAPLDNQLKHCLQVLRRANKRNGGISSAVFFASA
ncbi:Uncharacterised protein [Klebsiella pneumoniae]|uniref:Uncharacterized protein n=1 Tax=Klebsiella pneumoniae TaxID=573 RepID=A0A377TQU7_KLEPN|nr:Uncharacterised protein [Klebsiella pneumoniae]